MYRTDIINYLISKYNLKSYLEIGLDDPSRNFVNVSCKNKESVDPYLNDGNPYSEYHKEKNDEIKALISKCLTYKMTSDEFFEKVKNHHYDIIFIDALHTEDACGKDIINSLKILNPGGFIVVHDCLPCEEWLAVENPSFEQAGSAWMGTCYKAISQLHTQNIDFDVIDADCGCGIIRYVENPERLEFLEKSALSYNDIFSNINIRNNIMHVITEEEFWKKY